VWSQASAQKNIAIKERLKAQIRWDFQNCFKNYNFTGPTTTVDFHNPATFGKLNDDPRTASLGGQPLMNLTVKKHIKQRHSTRRSTNPPIDDPALNTRIKNDAMLWYANRLLVQASVTIS
jgi:hypothetical protein